MRIAIPLGIAGGRTWIRTTDLFLIRQAELPAHLNPRSAVLSQGTTRTAAICRENQRRFSQGVPTRAIADRAFGLQNDCSRGQQHGGAGHRGIRRWTESDAASTTPHRSCEAPCHRLVRTPVRGFRYCGASLGSRYAEMAHCAHFGVRNRPACVGWLGGSTRDIRASCCREPA